MRFYKQPHAFYCGIDLHARTMYLCVLDHAGARGPTGEATRQRQSPGHPGRQARPSGLLDVASPGGV